MFRVLWAMVVAGADDRTSVCAKHFETRPIA
jgi:hypothetical protein